MHFTIFQIISIYIARAHIRSTAIDEKDYCLMYILLLYIIVASGIFQSSPVEHADEVARRCNDEGTVINLELGAFIAKRGKKVGKRLGSIGLVVAYFQF